MYDQRDEDSTMDSPNKITGTKTRPKQDRDIDDAVRALRKRHTPEKLTEIALRLLREGPAETKPSRAQMGPGSESISPGALAPEVSLRGRRVTVELMYPNAGENPNEVEVGMCSVRSADSVVVCYDLDRDGWSILQASRFSFAPDGDQDPDWQEVAFIRAWQRAEVW